MKRALRLATAVFLSCCGPFSFAQTNTPSTEQPAASSNKKQKGALKVTAAIGPLEVLTDTMGVDFGPYLQRVIHDVRMNWYNVIPDSARSPVRKKGKVVIEFAILKDGSVVGMRIWSRPRGTFDLTVVHGEASQLPIRSHLYPPSSAASISDCVILPFYYNPDRADLGVLASPTGQSSSKSGIKVSISPPDGGSVPIGGSEVVHATVTGSTNTAVNWNVTGVGCVASACGTMSGDMYLAPKVLPSPSSVVLTATSEADSTVSAWVTIQLVKPEPTH